MNIKILGFIFTFILGLPASHSAFGTVSDDGLKRGAGSIEFTGYAPLSDRPITLYYYVPTKGDIRNMKILFSMHGAERSGQTQLNTWLNLAEAYGFIVLAPQFSQENGYANNDYQFGGVSSSTDEFVIKPREAWTFSVIEELFDYFREETGNRSDRFHLFGHSGGGQFVQRYMLAMPDAPVGRAIVANPGSYAFLDGVSLDRDESPSVTWPFAITGTLFDNPEYLRPYFSKDLIFMAGTLDTASVPANLTESHPINRQGSNRYQRASNFFRTSQVLAMEKGFEFNWQFKEVPHVGHSTSKMLYGNPELRSWTIEGTQRVYDNNDLTTMGAFNLLKPFLVVEEARIWYNPADEQSSVVHQQLWSRDDVGALYDRLPVYAEQIVRPEVWSRARDAAGLKLVFNTDAHDITIRYVVTRKKYAMSHFPATGVSGIDLFVENADRTWAWTNGRYVFDDTISYRYTDLRRENAPGSDSELGIFHLYLPLYNQVEWLEIGVPAGSQFEFVPSLAGEDPIIVYGTSIAQGGCASRPGMAWTNILNRELHTPVVNLGFSNQGRLEQELIDLIVEKEAKAFIIDCLPNLVHQSENIRFKLTDAVQTIRRHHPDTPIILADHSHYFEGLLSRRRAVQIMKVNKLSYDTYLDLKADGVKHLYYLENSSIGIDMHDSVDGLHPTDRGMVKYAEAFRDLLKSLEIERQQ